MTYKYYFIRRAIYEDDPNKVFNGNRSLRDILKLYRIPRLFMIVVVFALGITIIVKGLSHDETKNTLVLLLTFIFIAVFIDVPREKYVYNMIERQREISEQNKRYDEYIAHIKKTFLKYGIDNAERFHLLKKECCEKIESRKKNQNQINNKLIEVCLTLIIGSLVPSALEQKIKNLPEVLIILGIIFILGFSVIKIYEIITYFIYEIYKDNYLLGVMNEMEYQTIYQYNLDNNT